MQSFMKIKSSRNGKITQSFTDAGKSCPIREFLVSQICLLKLFARIKFSQKFLDLQYDVTKRQCEVHSNATNLHPSHDSLSR